MTDTAGPVVTAEQMRAFRNAVKALAAYMREVDEHPFAISFAGIDRLHHAYQQVKQAFGIETIPDCLMRSVITWSHAEAGSR